MVFQEFPAVRFHVNGQIFSLLKWAQNNSKPLACHQNGPNPNSLKKALKPTQTSDSNVPGTQGVRDASSTQTTLPTVSKVYYVCQASFRYIPQGTLILFAPSEPKRDTNSGKTKQNWCCLDALSIWPIETHYSDPCLVNTCLSPWLFPLPPNVLRPQRKGHPLY